MTDDRTLAWYAAAGCCEVLCSDIICCFKTKLHWIADMLVGSPAIGALLAGLLGPSHTSKRMLHALIMMTIPH